MYFALYVLYLSSWTGGGDGRRGQEPGVNAGRRYVDVVGWDCGFMERKRMVLVWQACTMYHPSLYPSAQQHNTPNPEQSYNHTMTLNLNLTHHFSSSTPSKSLIRAT